jgi:phosphatidylglycerol:prolipoprotein diacylglycerol transferase
MLPVLQIGPLALPIYPLSLLLAIWATLAVGAWAARRLGVAGDHLYNAGLYGLIAAVVVARLAHVAAFWSAYRTQPLEIVGFNARAFLWWPGLAAALVVAAWYIRHHRLSWVKMTDAAALGALVGIGIACLGAFLAGRGLGAPTGLPWGISTWDFLPSVSTVWGAVWSWRLPARGLEADQAKTAWRGIARAWPRGIDSAADRARRADSITTLGGLRVIQLLGLADSGAGALGLRRRSNGRWRSSGADRSTLLVE